MYFLIGILSLFCLNKTNDILWNVNNYTANTPSWNEQKQKPWSGPPNFVANISLNPKIIGKTAAVFSYVELWSEHVSRKAYQMAELKNIYISEIFTTWTDVRSVEWTFQPGYYYISGMWNIWSNDCRCGPELLLVFRKRKVEKVGIYYSGLLYKS